jgi:hypothetical protein
MSSLLLAASLPTKRPKFAVMAQSWIETGTLVVNRTVKTVAKLSVKLPPLFVAGAFLVSLSGCLDDEPRKNPAAPTPAVFVPEQFTDIPLPKSYMFIAGEDQLAVSLANGSVRRFEVALEQRETASPQSPQALLQEMERNLLSRGWQLLSNDGLNQRWLKNQEHLLLETGRSGGRSTIRLRLRPTQAVGP